jgi:two-component system, cell cycle sensor histidine kinase and response regulator CckA
VDEQYAVTYREARAGRYVLLEVADNGEGMTPEVVERIFEPFFTTKEVGKGTGLGLSTVLGIVRSHGGFVHVASDPGKGSTFKVYLPALASDTVEANSVPAEERFPGGHGELVLVVDDELPILSITKQTLESFGYKVLTARDGAQAIGIYAGRSAEVALVLTDMMMPIMDGPALITALRRINPQVRVIAASGLNVESNLGRATQAKVQHFLPKPYSADILLQTIRRALQDSASKAPF